MNFEDKYLGKFNFTKGQVENNLKNALKDLDIARRDKILEVKFSYAYTAFIKSGITLLSYHRLRVKSQPGHHAKIIETLARMLNDESIADIGNAMRSKRNLDLYSGGIEVTEMECRQYIEFVAKTLSKIKAIILKKFTEDR